MRDISETSTAGNKGRAIYTACCNCGKIKGVQGRWQHPDFDLKKLKNDEVSHAICPECVKICYPELDFMSINGQMEFHKGVPDMQKSPLIVIASEKGKGTAFILSRKNYICGRSASRDIVINDQTVSVRHCEFKKLPDGSFQVIDLNSTNGVIVNGKHISEAVLKNGDIITIGRILLVYIESLNTK
jgi:hypothetical protein